ncbi:plasmid pRiA4b ORF-3 family protein [Streptosporangium subroseum]|uniref:plasmid pRiA4b ORF-3 family protein n=1 Tax=Streptosporangium subroseum TaxID=106412 RepID=UPI0034473575
MIGAATVAPVIVTKGRFVVGTIHQLKVTLRDAHPLVWRRIHVPSTANLLDLHNVIQFAMGWDNEHLHMFAKEWMEYGDNASSEYDVTLAALLPTIGGRLAYRYDFGDCWDHDIEVEKIHQGAPKTTYPRCTAGGRACPPEDTGGPDGFVEHLRALRHRKGWKYQQARHLFGSGTWDGAAWDKDEVNDHLAELAKHWAKRDANRARELAAEQEAATSAKTSPAPSSPANDRPENGGFRDGEATKIVEGHRPGATVPKLIPQHARRK